MFSSRQNYPVNLNPAFSLDRLIPSLSVDGDTVFWSYTPSYRYLVGNTGGKKCTLSDPLAQNYRQKIVSRTTLLYWQLRLLQFTSKRCITTHSGYMKRGWKILVERIRYTGNTTILACSNWACSNIYTYFTYVYIYKKIFFLQVCISA